MLLVAQPTTVNRYVVLDCHSRRVLLGPFDSHPEPAVVAQHLANTANRGVQLNDAGVTVDRVFFPMRIPPPPGSGPR